MYNIIYWKSKRKRKWNNIQLEVEEALAKLQNGPDGDALYQFFGRLIGNCGNTGLPPLGAMGFTAASLECYYDEAFRMYNSGQYENATKIFLVMTILAPTEHKFTFALAVVTTAWPTTSKR